MSSWFKLHCSDCGAATGAVKADSGEVTEVQVPHADNCPFLLAYEISPDSAKRYIAQFGYPIRVVSSPKHEEN